MHNQFKNQSKKFKPKPRQLFKKHEAKESREVEDLESALNLPEEEENLLPPQNPQQLRQPFPAPG